MAIENARGRWGRTLEQLATNVVHVSMTPAGDADFTARQFISIIGYPVRCRFS